MSLIINKFLPKAKTAQNDLIRYKVLRRYFDRDSLTEKYIPPLHYMNIEFGQEYHEDGDFKYTHGVFWHAVGEGAFHLFNDFEEARKYCELSDDFIVVEAIIPAHTKYIEGVHYPTLDNNWKLSATATKAVKYTKILYGIFD